MDTEKFHDELIDLWNNYYNTEYVYDIIFVDDDYIEVKCENKKIANEFADFIMAYYKAPICYDFRKENGCYQFSISPSLMIRESKKSAKKSLKEEKVTDSLFTDVGFSMIKKFKLKKEYDVERPSWTVFNFRHKNKDAQFAITFDERGHGDFLYGDVLAFGDEKDDIFKYKTDEVKVDSYNIEKECSNIIADCLAFIDSNKKITIFESKKSARKSIKEGRIDKGAVVYAFSCMLNELGFKAIDYSNEENNEKCDDIVYMIMDLLKTMPRL